MQDIMATCQELNVADVELARSEGAIIAAAPTAPAPAVAEGAIVAVEHATLDEETFAAMRWASKLSDDSSVLRLIRSLPKEIVEEQLSLYRRRDETAVAAKAEEKGPDSKINASSCSQYNTRMLVAQRFHRYCLANAITVEKRLPYGAMKTFIKDNIEWTTNQKPLATNTVRKWYDT